MPEAALPGEIDTEVTDFRDGPARKDYVVVTDVPVLDEHLMTGDHENPEEWIGPDRLQQIAANNNNRINQTGDATPIIIGHTKDGLDERKQPPVVGFATNFVVHRLLNTQKQAIHADFHILKDRVEEVRNFPRRSVELWPKRWEIDPIALLGATTPERDLGLLQLQRYGPQSVGLEKPRRYSRILEESDMPKPENDAKPPKKDKAPPIPEDDEEEASGGGGDAKTSLKPGDIQAIIAALMETAPFKELMAAAGGAGGGDQDPGAIGGDPHDMPPMGGHDGPGGPGGLGGPHGEAAFFHEGPPQRYEEEDPMQYSGYGSSTADYMPGSQQYAGHKGGYVPYDGDGYFEQETMHQIPAARQRPVQRQRKSPDQIRYERYLIETGQAAPEDFMEAAGFEQPSDPRRLQRHDQQVKQRRQLTREQQLEAEVRKLNRRNLESDREKVLIGLQAQGWDLDVAEELPDAIEMSDAAFTKHVDRIKRKYSRDITRVQPIRPAEDGRINPVRMQRAGSQIDEAKRGQAIGGYMAQHNCDYATAAAAVETQNQSK